VKEKEPIDKCQICGYEAPSSIFVDNANRCPICGSEDVDDANTNPYEDDDNEEEELW
jgi:predicted Zn-ribbon and HTH transcriptional regulator